MTPREQAEIDVAVITADLQAAKERLRDAVKAEIAAVPPVPDPKDGKDAVALTTAILGPPTPDEGLFYPTWGTPELYLYIAPHGLPLWSVYVDSTANALDEALLSLSNHGHHPVTFDHALRTALLFLADRGVYLPARSS